MTGVQTCALPIWSGVVLRAEEWSSTARPDKHLHGAAGGTDSGLIVLEHALLEDWMMSPRAVSSGTVTDTPVCPAERRLWSWNIGEVTEGGDLVGLKAYPPRKQTGRGGGGEGRWEWDGM